LLPLFPLPPFLALTPLIPFSPFLPLFPCLPFLLFSPHLFFPFPALVPLSPFLAFLTSFLFPLSCPCSLVSLSCFSPLIPFSSITLLLALYVMSAMSDYRGPVPGAGFNGENGLVESISLYQCDPEHLAALADYTAYYSGSLFHTYKIGYKKNVEMSGIEPEAFRMRNRRSPTELHPLR
jgi:hypothetical protein